MAGGSCSREGNFWEPGHLEPCPCERIRPSFVVVIVLLHTVHVPDLGVDTLVLPGMMFFEGCVSRVVVSISIGGNSVKRLS